MTLWRKHSQRRGIVSQTDSLFKFLSSLWKLKYGKQDMPETATHSASGKELRVSSGKRTQVRNKEKHFPAFPSVKDG